MHQESKNIEIAKKDLNIDLQNYPNKKKKKKKDRECLEFEPG